MEIKYTKLETDATAAVHAIRSDLTPSLRKILTLPHTPRKLTQNKLGLTLPFARKSMPP